MPIDAEADHRIGERLRAAGVSTNAPRHDVIVIHVSAGNPFRRWPEESFSALVTGLVMGDERRRVILSSGPSDREAADRIADTARRALGSLRAAQVLPFGEINLAELRALVGRSALFIGGDTGPLHIASTTRTPIVGLYGPTLSARSAPWRPQNVPTESIEIAGLTCRPCEQRVCEPGDFRCLTRIDPQVVLERAERALAAGVGHFAGARVS
jgi:ADP-heptose:LPS heptosyltransferase